MSDRFKILLSVVAIIFLIGVTALVIEVTQKQIETPRFSTTTDAQRRLEDQAGIDNQKDIGPEKQPQSNWPWLQKQKKLFELTPAETDLLLKEVQKRFPDKNERLEALSIWRLGTPYQLGCLGEEKSPDQDLIFRVDVTDCTAFILTTVALLHSQSLGEAREMMKFLNYRQENEITFENRLHFTTDRNLTSPYFQDITEQAAGLGEIKEKKVILNKVKEDGQRLIDIDWQREVIIKYIPSEYIAQDFLNGLPRALGIAFIKEGDEKFGLDVRHEGFLFEGKDFIHAGSVQGEVAEVNFLDYYFDEPGNARFDGIILFEIK